MVVLFIILAIIVTVSIFVSVWTLRLLLVRLEQIHLLVNSQLSDMLDKLEKVTGERDEARRKET